jgi:hypothetical protein
MRRPAPSSLPHFILQQVALATSVSLARPDPNGDPRSDLSWKRVCERLTLICEYRQFLGHQLEFARGLLSRGEGDSD